MSAFLVIELIDKLLNKIQYCEDRILLHNISYNQVVQNDNKSFDAFRKGTIFFRNAKTKQELEKSLECFDLLIKINIESKKKLWQRGITLFYLDRFREAAKQFRFDVAQNPNDTEEAIWCFICEQRINGKEQALKDWLYVDYVKDEREFMQISYSLFQDKATKNDLLKMVSKSHKDAFYAHFYLALYEETRNNIQLANEYMKKATLSKYKEDYMYDVAVVHMRIRGWVSQVDNINKQPAKQY